VKLLVNIVTGKARELEDNREYSEELNKKVKHYKERNGVDKKLKRK